LKEGHAATVKKITDLRNARDRFTRLTKYNVPDWVREEILIRAARDLPSLSSIEELARRADALAQMGCVMGPNTGFDEIKSFINVAYECVAKMRELTGAADSAFDQLIKGKEVRVASEGLVQAVEEKQALQATLTDEWKSLADATKLLNISGASEVPPRSIPSLQTEINALREACLTTLGDDGMVILKFLRGEADFPGELTIGQIQHALTVLRPTLTRALKGTL
jgi:hypothetical protein